MLKQLLKIAVGISFLLVMVTACSEDDDKQKEIVNNELTVSLDYTSGVYITDKSEIQFEITSGNGDYRVSSSDEKVAETTLLRNEVTVKFHKHLEADITISDGKGESITIPMFSNSREITAATTYLNLRLGSEYSHKFATGYSLLYADKNMVEVSFKNNLLEFTTLKEGETEIRLVNDKGDAYAFWVSTGNPDLANVTSTLDRDWISGNLDMKIGINQLTLIHFLWSDGDFEDTSWDYSHDMGRLIRKTSPDGHYTLEIITSSYSWARGWVRHLVFTDDKGKSRSMRLELEYREFN